MQVTSTSIPIVLILSSVAMSAAAQMLLKLGVGTVASARTLSDTIWGYASSPLIIAGFALYGLGACVWLFVLARLPLSVAYPFVGLGFVFTMLLGYFLLNEQVSFIRIVGTLMIAIGCVLVARSLG